MTRAVAAESDFGKQIEIALALPESTDYITHVLYHAIFLSLHQLAPSVPHSAAALGAILVVMLPVPLMAFALLKRAAGDSLPAPSLVALSFAFSIAAPITIWTDTFLLGYFNPISYHSPTLHHAAPFCDSTLLACATDIPESAVSQLKPKSLYFAVERGRVVGFCQFWQR